MSLSTILITNIRKSDPYWNGRDPAIVVAHFIIEIPPKNMDLQIKFI